MNTNTLKGYLLTIFFGLVVFAGVIFLVLQWGVKSTFSLYGKPMDVETIWLVSASAVAGPLFYGACRLTLRGVRILFASRRAEALQKGKDAPAAGGDFSRPTYPTDKQS